MKYTRLVRAVDIPESHLIDDIEEFDQLLKLFNEGEETVEQMKDEDKKELSHSEEQILSNKRTQQLPEHDISTIGDNYNNEI